MSAAGLVALGRAFKHLTREAQHALEAQERAATEELGRQREVVRARKWRDSCGGWLQAVADGSAEVLRMVPPTRTTPGTIVLHRKADGLFPAADESFSLPVTTDADEEM